MTALINVINFLATLAFSLITLLLMLRLLLHAFKASSNNSVCHTVAMLTNPLVLPLRKVLPKIPLVDISSLLLLLAIDVLKYQLLLLLGSHPMLSIIQLCYVVPCDIIIQGSRILLVAVVLHVVLSWVASHLHNAFTDVIATLAQPPIRLGRKLLSNAGGFDFGPMVAIIVLYIIQIVITSYIPASYFF